MTEENGIESAIRQAYRRMHRYTCAEASLQALLEIWKLPKEKYSWATAGYLGAILGGQTTCGVLIGSSIAIGIRHGIETNGIPEEHEAERSAAIAEINNLYKEFIKEFGSTDCKKLNQLDFTDSKAFAQWTVEKGWKKTCDVFLDFVIKKYFNK
ncbi:MAG: C-GCAxxG-C-C family protein [Deltaproteobacteria bacterium]|nr:C-GCAxxG-C-C family protein [Deltaproteobacteria bacterium]